MIDYTSVRRSIETYLATNFTAVPIQYENTHIGEVKEFIALFDQESMSDQSEMGSDVVIVHGGLIIQIFTPLGEGSQRGRELASLLSNMINTLETDVLRFETAVLASIGQVEDADYYQQNLTIPYTYAYAGDEITC